jgi:hypothetical protein
MIYIKDGVVNEFFAIITHAKERLLNNFFVIVVLSLMAFLGCFQTDALAQHVDPSEQEEAIYLDSLKEDEGKPHDGASSAQEALLEPSNADSTEREKHPALMWSALVVLVPVAALLLPIGRK